MICDHSNSGAERLPPPAATPKLGGWRKSMVQKPVESTSNNAESLPLKPFLWSGKLPPVATLKVGDGKKIDGPKARQIDVKQCRMTSPKALRSVKTNPCSHPQSWGVKKNRWSINLSNRCQTMQNHLRWSHFVDRQILASCSNPQVWGCKVRVFKKPSQCTSSAIIVERAKIGWHLWPAGAGLSETTTLP